MKENWQMSTSECHCL